MRRTIVGTFLAVAGGLGMLAAGRYMIAAPSIAARVIATAAILVFLIGVAYAAFPRRQTLGAPMMQYAIVGVVAAVLAIAAWWGLGFVPAEAKAPPPHLTAQVQEDGGDYFIVVENSGTEAVVWADIQIDGRHNFDEGSDQRVYKGYWENSRAARTTLRPGQQDRLVVGGVKDSTAWLIGRAGGPPVGPAGQNLHFAFYDPNLSGRGAVAQYWARGKTPEPPKPFLALAIALGADPALPSPMSGVYHLTVDGLFPVQPMAAASK